MIDVPAVVRNKARAAGAGAWLERLPALVSSLGADWSITVGHRRIATRGLCWSTATCTN
jgi:hypothetical protein